MKTTILSAFQNIVIVLLLTTPVLVGAAVQPGPTPDDGGGGNGGGGISGNYTLENPIKVGSIQDLLTILLKIVIILATPIVVLFIILAGFKYVTARGNANQIEDATKALTNAIIGGVLIIGAVAISEIIKNLVNSFA
jgi:hypothetical protein